MATITNTEGAVFVATLWSREALRARVARLVMAERVLRKDSDVA